LQFSKPNLESYWEIIGDCIYRKSHGLKELKDAIDMMYEIQDHESLVLEAFRKGQKPPMKLS
jgi:hypothetical protein